MASIKVHVGKFENDGSESCDYRGDKFLGAEQGDHHRTILERDPASDKDVEWVLEHGPAINKGLDALGDAVDKLDLIPSKFLEISKALGGPEGVRLRIGVWDN